MQFDRTSHGSPVVIPLVPARRVGSSGSDKGVSFAPVWPANSRHESFGSAPDGRPLEVWQCRPSSAEGLVTMAVSKRYYASSGGADISPLVDNARIVTREQDEVSLLLFTPLGGSATSNVSVGLVSAGLLGILPGYQVRGILPVYHTPMADETLQMIS